MANALIDNSEQFRLVKYIKELISRPDCNHIMIATGYWDLPGTALVYEELKDFIFVSTQSSTYIRTTRKEDL